VEASHSSTRASRSASPAPSKTRPSSTTSGEAMALVGGAHPLASRPMCR